MTDAVTPAGAGEIGFRTTRITLSHSILAIRALTGREVMKFLNHRGRLASALVRPVLWLLVFAAGFRNVLGISIIPPYETYTEYAVYMVPGLLGIVLLFQTMQSSLSMVYDREMGVMRLLLTAPMPRWYLLFAKLVAAAFLSMLQAYTFLLICLVFGVWLPWQAWFYILPAMFMGAVMLGSVGLLLSVYVKQLENFAGTMNFVIFPMFFISSALFPIWKLRESGAQWGEWLFWLATINPFTHVVELIRFAAYGKFNGVAFAVVLLVSAVFFTMAVIGYDPQRGMLRRVGRPG